MGDSLEDATIVHDSFKIQKAIEISRVPSVAPANAPTLPGYQLEQLLGSGACGQVWAGVQTSTGQKVAVKLFLTTSGLDMQYLTREVERLREVAENPYVTSLLDANLKADPPFFVMPLLPQSLSAFAKTATLEQIEKWLGQMARGLSFTHRKGILHCDLKPPNVLVDLEGNLRLADFGQSLLSDEHASSLGTLGYMAPEQAGLLPDEKGSGPDVRWDIYALGATAYFLCTGQSPRFTSKERETLESLKPQDRLVGYGKILASTPLVPVASLRPELDPDLAVIIERCLEVDPKRRTPSADNVLQDLERRHDGRPLLCRRPWSRSYLVRRWLGRNRTGLAVAAVAVLLGLAGLSVASNPNLPEGPEVASLPATQASPEAYSAYQRAAAALPTPPSALQLDYAATVLHCSLREPALIKFVNSPEAQSALSLFHDAGGSSAVALPDSLLLSLTSLGAEFDSLDHKAATPLATPQDAASLELRGLRRLANLAVIDFRMQMHRGAYDEGLDRAIDIIHFTHRCSHSNHPSVQFLNPLLTLMEAVSSNKEQLARCNEDHLLAALAEVTAMLSNEQPLAALLNEDRERLVEFASGKSHSASIAALVRSFVNQRVGLSQRQLLWDLPPIEANGLLGSIGAIFHPLKTGALPYLRLADSRLKTDSIRWLYAEARLRTLQVELALAVYRAHHGEPVEPDHEKVLSYLKHRRDVIPAGLPDSLDAAMADGKGYPECWTLPAEPSSPPRVRKILGEMFALMPLVPEYLPRLPEDPFTAGYPLRYKERHLWSSAPRYPGAQTALQILNGRTEPLSQTEDPSYVPIPGSYDLVFWDDDMTDLEAPH